MYERILNLLTTCGTEKAVLPHTALYNEGWMMRLVLDWFSSRPGVDHPLAFLEGSRWFSEALLPSQFKPADDRRLGESYTHADGVIAQFTLGRMGYGDMNLESEATQFIVVEAKMFSPLSSRVTHAEYYNQAARNVACIAQLLHEEGRRPASFERLGFHVLAPEAHLEDEPTFAGYMSGEDIRKTVTKRVEEYGEGDVGRKKKEWYRDHFLPLLEKIDIQALSWEDVVGFIGKEDAEAGAGLLGFYAKCLEFNRRPGKRS